MLRSLSQRGPLAGPPSGRGTSRQGLAQPAWSPAARWQAPAASPLSLSTGRSQHTPRSTAGSAARTRWCPTGTATAGTARTASSTTASRRCGHPPPGPRRAHPAPPCAPPPRTRKQAQGAKAPCQMVHTPSFLAHPLRFALGGGSAGFLGRAVSAPAARLAEPPLTMCKRVHEAVVPENFSNPGGQPIDPSLRTPAPDHGSSLRSRLGAVLLSVGVFCAVFLEDKFLLIVTCKEGKEESLEIRHHCLECHHSGLLPCHQA